MKKALFLSLVSLFSLFTLASCKVEVANKDKGDMKAWKVNAKDFDGIELAYPADVTYIPSSTYSVTVKAPSSMMDKLNIVVKNGKLEVYENKTNKNGKRYIIFNSHRGDVDIVVKAPSISKVSIAGSGSFECEKTMKAKNIQLSIAGSGEIDINDIQANTVIAEITGSGDIDAGLTKVSTTSIDIAGSGDVEMNFRQCKEVKASISGSGDIKLSGDIETLKQNVAGSGDINIENLRIQGKNKFR